MSENAQTKIDNGSWPALFPCPVVLVTSISPDAKPNIITLAWAGVTCSNPPTMGLGINPHRYSHKLIERSKEFVINIPTTAILKETDLCGVLSGKDVDKFSKTGLTPKPAKKVKPPLIAECPVNIECKLKKIIPLGSHHLFIGEAVLVHVSQNALGNQGKIDFSKLSLFAYNHGEYWSLNQKIGLHGFSTK